MSQVGDDPGLHDAANDDEEADEEEERRPFDGLEDLVDVLAGDDHQNDGPRQRDGCTLEPREPAEQESEDGESEHDRRDPHQARVCDLALLVDEPLDVIGIEHLDGDGQLRPEDPAREIEVRGQRDGRSGRQVDQEVVEVLPHLAADDDVRWIADQRRGPTDIGRDDLRDEKGHW